MNQTSFLINKGAQFSPCKRYRYNLWRIWGMIDGPMVAFVGLNPSTATDIEDDPTIRRCIGYARDWGYDGIYMLNIFAYRSTDPKNLYKADDPIGPYNSLYLSFLSWRATITIACWGTHGNYLNRGKEVTNILKRPYCLGFNHDRTPKHPLYLRKDLKPIPWRKNV